MFVPGRPDFGTSSAATPNTFAPNVTEGETPLSPAASPFVRPMRNAAPGEMQQFGETLSQAGATAEHIGNTIGDAVEDTMDDANTKAAENQFLQGAQSALAQYKASQGNDAVTQWDPTAQAISKARQDARAKLTPIQQQMFDPVSNAHMLSFGQQMQEHRGVQEVEYGKQQSSARADMLNTQAVQAYLSGNMAAAAQYGGAADAETLHLAKLSGQAPGSDATQAMLQVKHSQALAATFAGLHDKGAFNEAHQLLQQDGGNVDPVTFAKLSNADRAMMQQVTPKNDVNQAIMATLGMKGPGVLLPPAMGATITTTTGADGTSNDIHMAPGSPVKAPASGTVTKVWTDDKNGGGLTMDISLPGGYTQSFNHLSAANYEAGQKITVGQTLGLSGQDANKQGVVNYSMTDANGQPIDPRQASSAPEDPKNFFTAAQEDAVVQRLNATIANPEELSRAITLVHGTANSNRQINNQEHAAVVKQVTDYSLAHGGSLAGLPAALSMQLTPEDRLGFEKQNVELYGLGQRVKNEDEVPTVNGWIENPATLTVDSVNKALAQGNLSQAGFQRWMPEAQKLQGADTGSTDPQKVRAATFDNNRLKYFANQAGMNVFGTQGGSDQAQTADDKALMNNLHIAVQDAVNQEQQAKGRKLTLQESDAIMQRELTKQTLTQLRSSSNPLVAMGILGKRGGALESPYRFQLPSDAEGQMMPDAQGRQYIVGRLQDAGIQNPTDEQIGAYYRTAVNR